MLDQATFSGQGTVLGFDFGTKRIGIAVGETRLRCAHPLTTIDAETNEYRFAMIARLIEEWKPVALVVGRPVHADGNEHEMTKRSDRFANQLHGRYRLPVFRSDERYTSVIAETMLYENKKKDKKRIDAVAAQLILQAWLDQLRLVFEPATRT